MIATRAYAQSERDRVIKERLRGSWREPAYRSWREYYTFADPDLARATAEHLAKEVGPAWRPAGELLTHVSPADGQHILYVAVKRRGDTRELPFREPGVSAVTPKSAHSAVPANVVELASRRRAR